MVYDKHLQYFFKFLHTPNYSVENFNWGHASDFVFFIYAFVLSQL
jgi:hypothetical protein